MQTATREAFTRAVADPKAWGLSLRVDIIKTLAHSRSGAYSAPRYDVAGKKWVVPA